MGGGNTISILNAILKAKPKASAFLKSEKLYTPKEMRAQLEGIERHIEGMRALKAGRY